MNARWKMQEFFAGCGLAGYALRKWFDAVWANDISERKAAVYRANFDGSVYILEDVKSVKGADVPEAHLSWASFPCQDLSLAGKMEGINSSRSGLVWEWFRILDEMPVKPKVLALENVMGYVSADGGSACRAVHRALMERGYVGGTVMLDASLFLPQSRKRIFHIAVKKATALSRDIAGYAPCWLHPSAVQRIGQELDGWIWWTAPKPTPRTECLQDIVEDGIPFDKDAILNILSDRHKRMLEEGGDAVAAGYQRTRNGRQVLELRLDGLAGCLRTLAGGCNRQYLVAKQNGEVHARLMTLREAGRLMGVPDSFAFPGGYRDGWDAMGDAVAVPAVEFIGRHFLAPLAEAAYAS